WVPPTLAASLALFLVLAGRIATHWMPVRWRLLVWGGAGLLAAVAVPVASLRYVEAWHAGTAEVPVQHGDGYRQERRVKGTELTPMAREILKRRTDGTGG